MQYARAGVRADPPGPAGARSRWRRCRCATVAAINGFALGGGSKSRSPAAIACVADDPAVDARLSRSAARRASGLRRHRARRAARRPDRGDGSDADRPLDPAETSARARTGRSAGAAELSSSDVAKQVALESAARQRTCRSRSPAQFGAGAPDSRRADALAGCEARAPRALPCPVRAHRAVATLRRQGRARVRGRSALDGGAAVHADLAQPGARVLPAGSSQVCGQGRRRAGASTCTSSALASWAATLRAWCAARGLTVTLQDRAEKYVAPAHRARAQVLREALSRPGEARTRRWRACSADVEGRGVAAGGRGHRSDLRESRCQARAVRAARAADEAAARCSRPTLPASCSSSWRENLARPQRLIGLHFFNPVARMPLIEVIHAERTRPADGAGRPRVRTPDRQARDRLSQLAGIPRQPRADALPERSGARRGGRHSACADRSRGGGLRHADGADRARRRRRTRRRHERRQGVLRSPAPRCRTCCRRAIEQKKFGKKTGEGFYVWRDDKPQKPPTAGRRRRRICRIA